MNYFDKQEKKIPDAYERIYTEELSEIHSLGQVFRHKKTGARVVTVSNDDKNKVFYIGFRTPPKDSTGVAHIVEHTVLCGSKKYPAKDPFVELAKGSLNTFLNAMTYSDKTVYPVASENEKDFQNLMSVYMDAVFYPNIYREEKIFKQEGWHYELTGEDQPVTINGVVYNEMKGVFSSADQQLYRSIQRSLLKDTTYGNESGGDPENIPELTYQDYLDFHRKFYHPSNSYIYLYGDMDVAKKLEWMDQEYLKDFEQLDPDSEITLQSPYTQMQTICESYAIADEDPLENRTYISYNLQMDNCRNQKLYVALQVLEYVLLSSPAAPLKKALIKAGIGEDIMSSYDAGILQPIFSIIAKNTEAERKDEFLSVIQNTLQQLSEEGLDKKALLGALNMFEFQYREADFGRYPKGLIYGLSLLESWLYSEEDIFMHVKDGAVYAQLKEQIESGYFENVIKEYFLNNRFSTVVVLKPEKGLTAKKEKALEEKLAEYKQSLTKEQLLQLIRETKELKEYQDTPDSPEVLARLPKLKRSDIDAALPKICNEQSRLGADIVVHHDIYTNGISYVRICYPLDGLEGYAPYLFFMTTCMGYMDSVHMSFDEISSETDIYTGGIITDIERYIQNRDTDDFRACFEIRSKFLTENMEQALALMKETALYTSFDDRERLKEIVTEAKARLQVKLSAQGNSVAANRAESYYSKSALFSEALRGIEYYRFLTELEADFDQKKEELVRILKGLVKTIFSRENRIISITGDPAAKKQLCEKLSGFFPTKEELSVCSGQLLPDRSLPEPVKKNEGFKYSGQVQYVAHTGNFKKAGYSFHGALRVLKTILNYDYLWLNIRVKGGAYGCASAFSPDGNTLFTSYRDPNLEKTEEVYQKLWEYVESFEADEEEMTKYIIGTFSSMDTERTPAAKGSRSFNIYMNGVSAETLEKERQEALNATAEDIRQFAQLIRAVTQEGYLCAIGNEKRVEESKEMFLEVKSLL